jgi:hypothetical protein
MRSISLPRWQSARAACSCRHIKPGLPIAGGLGNGPPSLREIERAAARLPEIRAGAARFLMAVDGGEEVERLD